MCIPGSSMNDCALAEFFLGKLPGNSSCLLKKLLSLCPFDKMGTETQWPQINNKNYN